MKSQCVAVVAVMAAAMLTPVSQSSATPGSPATQYGKNAAGARSSGHTAVDRKTVVLQAQADAAYDKKDWAGCIKIDEVLLARNPRNFDAGLEEGDALMAQAEDAMDGSVASKNTVDYVLARKLLAANAQRTIALDRTMIRMNPRLDDAYSQEANVQKSIGTPSASLATDEEAIMADRRAYFAYYQAADTAFDIGDYKTSIQYNERLVAVDPHQESAYADGGWLMESLKDNSDAEAFYQKGIAQNPSSAPLNYQLGFFYYNVLHNYSKALASFTRATQCPGADWNDWKMLAHSQEKSGNWIEASATWKLIWNKYGSNKTYAPVVYNNMTRVQKYIADHNITADAEPS